MRLDTPAEYEGAPLTELGTRSDITLQHLPSVAHGPASLSSTALPSHTSAAKFVTSRLYSKKRQVAVLDAGRQDAASQPRNPKKVKGMSFESKVLLGLADPADEDKEKDKEKKRKRSLLLQADGQRKSGASTYSGPPIRAGPCPLTSGVHLFLEYTASIARPLSSARRGAKPAGNFAVSSFRG